MTPRPLSLSQFTEVDAVAADLVRNGTPPYDAIGRARDIVAARRRQKNGDDPFPLDKTCSWPSQIPGRR